MSIKVKALRTLYMFEKRIYEGQEFEFPEERLATKEGKKYLPDSVCAVGKLPAGVFETCDEQAKMTEESPKASNKKEEKSSGKKKDLENDVL